jgi:hypothetical protein
MEILMVVGGEKTKPIQSQFWFRAGSLGLIQHNSGTFSWSGLQERLYCSLFEIGIL